MRPDRKALKVLLALLDMPQGKLAECMGYDEGYVVNVLNGFTTASPGFRRAFGETIATLVLGVGGEFVRKCYPPGPLIKVVVRAAEEAPSKRDFYRDLGTSLKSLRNQKSLDGILVDRICCALGIHPSTLYGRDYEVGEES